MFDATQSSSDIPIVSAVRLTSYLTAVVLERKPTVPVDGLCCVLKLALLVLALLVVHSNYGHNPAWQSDTLQRLHTAGFIRLLKPNQSPNIRFTDSAAGGNL